MSKLDVEDLEYTPRSKERRMNPDFQPSNDVNKLEEDKLDEDKLMFISPLKAPKKPAFINPDVDSTETEDNVLKASNGKAEAGKNKAAKQPFQEMVKEKKVTTATNNKQTIIKPAGNTRVHQFLTSDD